MSLISDKIAALNKSLDAALLRDAQAATDNRAKLDALNAEIATLQAKDVVSDADLAAIDAAQAKIDALDAEHPSTTADIPVGPTTPDAPADNS